MSVRLKNLTALTLVVLYGLVGMTGVSLHYLADESNLAAFDGPALASGGYFHSHQPDNHLHFHHHHHGARQVEPTTPQSSVEVGQAATSLGRNYQFHNPHACPLLTLVSQLRLGQGGWVAIRIESDVLHASSGEANLRHAFGLASLVHARGPPETLFLV